MTLEKGKSYGQEQIQQTLQDKARTRLNNPTPHQAPQRERVSRGGIPSGRAGALGRVRSRRWKALIRPDVNMGVPSLMMILEPNIVWEHTKAFVSAVGKEVEATITPGEFFEGWHKGGRRAHGVYEGSYWELMGDCDELAEMLRKMSKAPALLEEPPLELPPPPELPSWEDFKPNLHLIPAAPSLPPLKLPPFRTPILEPEPPFVEPEYLPLPVVPPVPKEEPLPIFIPPEFLQLEPLQEPQYVDPEPPVLSEPPRPPSFGQPKHGHDWTGEHPFQLDLPNRETFIAEAASHRVMDTSRFVHPPPNLPMVPELEPLDVDLLKGLDLDPIPKLELAWMGGPEPDPPYCSVPSSPAALSRHSSRTPSLGPGSLPGSLPHSRPHSAVVTPTKDGSGSGSGALPTQASSGSPASRPRSSSAHQRPLSAAAASGGGDADGAAAHRPQSAAASSGGAGTPPRLRSSRRGGTGSSGGGRPSSAVKTAEEQAWEEVRSVASEASGTPRMWVNFAAPFADLPPIMLPPRPEPGPEPLPAEFPHEVLEELPPFLPPPPLEVPTYAEPPQYVPAWAAPCEPRPVGFLRGTAPLIICDVSGTMNPRQQGRFREMKRCAVDLLDPEGEVATAAAGFDVITFAGGAWSWSAGYGERMGLLQSSQVPYSGRQVGGRYSSKTPPGAGGGSRSGSPERSAPSAGASRFSGAVHASGPGLALMPTTPELLADAQRWAANWPEAVGQTNLLGAFGLADQHAAADCWYILSDGLAHDQQGCLDYLAKRAEAGLPLPVIHAVGFIPTDAHPDSHGERFLRGLAELTGGSYQRYTPDIAKVWITGQGFVRVDLRSETPEQREERQWAERQLRAERIKNLRLGIAEPLEVTMERVMALHAQLRVAPAVRANEAAVAEARRRHAVAVESVRVTNERRLAEATASYEAAVADVRDRNQAKVDAARDAFLQAHTTWERDYLDRLQDWEEAKETLERQREEQLASMRAAAPSTPPRERPTSATRYATYPQTKAGAIISPKLEVSEQRAAYASAEYDSIMGVDRLSEKLSPAPTPPGSRPVSGVPYSGGGGSGSGSGGGSRPVSARCLSGMDAAGASEYLEAIVEDMAEASAPLDAFNTSAAAAAAAAAATAADGLDDDGLDVRPSTGRSGGRDQDGGSAAGGARAGSASVVRPVSARPVSGRPSSGRVASARSTTSASGLKGGLLGGGAYGSMPRISETALGPPPPLPEPTAPLQPLRGERSEEFKRRVLPPEVVEEHDAVNAARLDEIRDRWEALLAADVEANHGRKLAAMKRNAARLADYHKAVYEAYANTLVRDVVYGGAVRVAANLAIMDNGEARYQAEVARIEAENARLREQHAAEVAERRIKEETHEEAHARWHEHRAALLREHEAARQTARAEHETNLTRIRAEYRTKKQEVLELNDARLSEAEAAYNELVEKIKETNKALKSDHTELLRQRREVEAVNLSRLAEAKTVHKVRLEARAADNERLIKQAMEEHQALCVRLTEEYEESKVQAQTDHTELCAFLRAANEQLMEEARRRYQEALAEVQTAYEEDCALVREGHARDLERIRRYNQDIWPKVHVARLAQAELARVQAFAEHIRFCANKFEMGINLMPNTPNYDRVVEMQALTESLARAFPDMGASELPWPDHERRFEPGTGWVAAPAPRPATYRDPAEMITRIAKGKSAGPPSPPTESQRASPASARVQSAGGGRNATSASGEAEAGAGVLTSSGSIDEQAQHHLVPYNATGRHLSRPLSAGRARFAGVLSAEAAAGLRPMSAAVPGAAAVAGRIEAWGAAAAAVSALSSPGGAAATTGFLRPQSAAGGAYQNPSAWRRSNTTVLRAASPRGPGASNLGGAAAAVAAAAAAAMAPGSCRPMTCRPGTAQAAGGMGMGMLPPARPRSAGSAPRPARVAVDILPLQASVARSKAQAGAHILTGATLAGFAKDVPKLRYPEVDVQQPLSMGR